MARSQYSWLIVFETGEVQFAKAQSIDQIIYNDKLLHYCDSIINITKLDSDSEYEHQNIIEAPFED